MFNLFVRMFASFRKILCLRKFLVWAEGTWTFSDLLYSFESSVCDVVECKILICLFIYFDFWNISLTSQIRGVSTSRISGGRALPRAAVDPPPSLTFVGSAT